LNDFFVAVLLILGLVAAGIWWRHLRDAKLLRLREMIHQERMTNMESNSSGATNDQALDEFLLDYAKRESRPSNPAAAVMWVRLIALCIGLAGLFGGVGIAIGMFAVTSEPEISGAWSMGIIPAAIGLGLLVFYYLSRNFSVPSNGE
jgi:hypothetical protein